MIKGSTARYIKIHTSGRNDGNCSHWKNSSRSEIGNIETDKTGLLEIEKLDECYKYGYRGTMEKMNEILEIINQK